MTLTSTSVAGWGSGIAARRERIGGNFTPVGADIRFGLTAVAM
jgi:hypothetical protein